MWSKKTLFVILIFISSWGVAQENKEFYVDDRARSFVQANVQLDEPGSAEWHLLSNANSPNLPYMPIEDMGSVQLTVSKTKSFPCRPNPKRVCNEWRINWVWVNHVKLPADAPAVCTARTFYRTSYGLETSEGDTALAHTIKTDQGSQELEWEETLITDDGKGPHTGAAAANVQCTPSPGDYTHHLCQPGETTKCLSTEPAKKPQNTISKKKRLSPTL